MDKLAAFIEKAVQVHGDKYSYAESIYVAYNKPTNILCSKHGSFSQRVAHHLSGSGCKACSLEKVSASMIATTDSFVLKAKEKHGDQYDYSLVDYEGSNTNILVICPTHGQFSQRPTHHLSGHGCPKCHHSNTSARLAKDQDEFIKQCSQVHGNKYDYSMVVYKGGQEKIQIICPEHGVFEQLAGNHLYKRVDCFECGLVKNTITNDEFISRSKQAHGDKYEYLTRYTHSQESILIRCPEHGVFEQKANAHYKGHGCRLCALGSNKSNPERVIIDLLKSHDVSTDCGSRKVIPPYELDIYLPDHKLAIEYNGLYYHSSYGNNLRVSKTPDYHQKKMLLCRKAGIELLQIFEDEWINPVKQEIWKSIIKHKLGLTYNRIYARKCQIVELDFKTCSQFLEENHLMGKDSSPIRYGLTHDNVLVSVITFGKPNISSGKPKYDFNIGRFSVLKDTTVVGGFSKLLRNFLKRHPGVTLSTAADLRYSTGDVYTKNGFKHLHDSKPNYWYWKSQTRYHRFGFRKNVLKDKLEMFDPLLTEKQNMLNNKWNTIHDAGNAMFEYIN